MKKKLAELIEMLCYDASGDEDERYIWRTIKKADSVKPETEGRFFKMLNKMRRNPDLAGLVKAVDIARAYYKGLAFAKGMSKAKTVL